VHRINVIAIMLRGLCLTVVLAWLCPGPAWALDPNHHISQYAHAAWRIRDGFFSGTPTVLVQTSDGYLWLATNSELLRFDGVRFVPWSSAHGERLPSFLIDLLPARDGSLWIATSAEVARWKDQILTSYPGETRSLLEDRHGAIWFDRGDSSPASLCQVVESATRCFDLAGAVPSLGVPGRLFEDPEGTLWIGGTRGLLRWNGGSRTVYPLIGLSTNFAQGVTALASTPDGTTWVGIAKRGRGLGLQRLAQGRWQSFKMPKLDGDNLLVSALHVDREGALWIGTYDHGIYRLYRNDVDHFDGTRGLSGNFVQRMSSDREGNLWVTTDEGVDRFSETPVVSFSANEGLCAIEVDAVLTSHDGSLWVGSDGALSHLRDGRVSCLRTGKGLPGTQVTSLLEDHAGRLWVGVDNALWVNEHGNFRRVTKSDGSQIGFVTGMAEDAGNNVWVVANGPPRTVMRVQGLAVREEFHGVDMPRRVAVDPTGGIWLGLLRGDLAHYRNGKHTMYRFAHGDSAQLNQLLADADGSVLAATNYGLIAWQNGKQLMLTEKNGLPCNGVNGLTFDANGNLWLFMDCALGELTRADLRMWRSHPDSTVPVRSLNVFDGARTTYAPFGQATRSPDGRLWYSNGREIQMIDPAHLRTNAVPPPVHIEQVVADRRQFPANGVVRLPPLTRDLEIDYTGLSFVAPQRVLFRYRLQGREEAWQEPGTRRQAFYSDLRPGTYRFQVIASNNDGLWNEEGAALDFVVAPAWYQTKTFFVISVMTGVLVVWAAFRLRVRQVAQVLNARFDERLAERTRMARDIHDTLLQTVQASKMVADAALTRRDDAAGMERVLEQVSTWLGHVTTEGRAAVKALRTSTTEANDLADAFRRAIEDCQRQGTQEASVAVIGDPADMHPVVRDEVYRIGYEAIRNACIHGSGNRLDVELRYARDLVLRVADNGVGIDPAIADHGQEGHFGLQGMRERAARIGATFNIVTSSNAGTEIVVIVPGRAIFRRPSATRFQRLRAYFSR
jgi:signal transduction histidine kinase/ligand-binding sensor domain-containing protein